MKRLVFAITLVVVLMGSAIAQSRLGPPSPIDLWDGFSLSMSKLDGVEVSAGTLDTIDSICWGKTFSMLGEGGSFTMAPNYYYDQLLPTEPGAHSSKITGGSWTVVSTTEKANGMLFGEITGGSIEWFVDKEGYLIYGDITADMNIKGGTGDFKSVGGPSTYGKFTGRVHYKVRGVPRVVGHVDFNF